MPDWWNSLTGGFMPHGYCLRWDGPLLFVWIIGNAGIAIAYFSIPIALRHFASKRKDLPYPHMFRLFAAFIFSCGLTHVADIWTLYQPVYWVEATLDLWTAGVSMITAALLWPLIPRALALRSPKELEEVNRQLQREIEERRKAEAEARQARDEAVEANQLKSQFVANISHEVRTPMSGVIGLTEMLLKDPGVKGDARETAEHIFEASTRLLGVLNDLLDFSKLEAGRIDVVSGEFDIGTLVDEVAALTRPIAEKKGLAFYVAIDERLPPQLVGDTAKITQCLLNITHNAIKFTQEGSVKISVDVESAAGKITTVRFSVHDTGIGVDPEAQKRLFQPFVQADGTIQRKFGGTGLGFSITKRFIELMGGQIGFESEPAKGTIIWFVLPLEVAEVS